MSNEILRIHIMLAILCLLCLFPGCRRKVQSEFDVPYSRFAGAEIFREVQSSERNTRFRKSNDISNALTVEIKNLIDQDGMPADVFFGLSAKFSDTAIKLTDEEKQERTALQRIQEHNIALTLHSSFREFYEPEPVNPKKPAGPKKPLPDDLQKLWEASPIGAWDINQETLEGMKVTLAKMESKRQTIRDALKHPKTNYYYVFNRSETLRSLLYPGAKVNTMASRYLADYALLEEYAIAQALLDGDIESAIDTWEHVLRIAYLASTLKNVETRVDTAHVRLRAFDVLQRIILDPKFERKHMVALREKLLDERSYWTPEYDAWFGDRASGVLLFHHITMAGPENAFEPAELSLLINRGAVKIVKDGYDGASFTRSFQRYWKADALFYLQSMQKILDVSDLPFVKRADTLKQIENELSAKESTYDNDGVAMEPYVSIVLLYGVDRFMRLFALDRSALDRALTGILRSLGEENTDDYRDPFTDEPYEIRKVEGRISVSGTSLPRSFRVPVFSTDK